MSLSYEKVLNIEAKALDILTESYGVSLDKIYPPINPQKAASLYGIKIKKGNFTNKDISGFYKKEDKSIYISKEDSLRRQVFTIAHELGHYILHSEIKNEEILYRKNMIEFGISMENDESEANWFAVSLLMPKNLSIKVWNKLKDVSAIADLFGVSYMTAYWRLFNLGLLDSSL